MGSPEIIEGEAVEVFEPRAVMVVQQPGQSLVAQANDPADMVAVAARLATVLKDIVDRQQLYTVIQGKKYPQVEAWQTIGRLDNVVARESRPPVRHPDGSYEAFAEIIRLSDGMVIGGASALCGSPDDEPWGGTPAKYGKPEKGPRPENARRSMAATRAISRAFRGQYSWIMALAGYEPTPAEEMPRDEHPSTPAPAVSSSRGGSSPTGLVTMAGTVTRGTGNGMDLSRREGPDAVVSAGFKLTEVEGHPKGNKSTGVRSFGALALAVLAHADTLPGQRVVVSGSMRSESFDKKENGEVRSITYDVLVMETLDGPDFTIPAAGATDAVAPVSVAPGAPSDLDGLDW